MMRKFPIDHQMFVVIDVVKSFAMNKPEKRWGWAYKKSLSNLIISFRHVVGDDLGHGEGQTQDDQDLAVEGRDGGLQRIAEK